MIAEHHEAKDASPVALPELPVLPPPMPVPAVPNGDEVFRKRFVDTLGDGDARNADPTNA